MRLGKVYIDNAPVDNVDGLATVIPMPPFIPEILVRDHGGRPVGSTVKKRKQEELALIAATNEIALLFNAEKVNNRRGNKQTKKGRLAELIQQVLEIVTLPEHMKITNNTIRQRLKRKSVFSAIGQ